ncbi:3354_t:CDS:2, partial [Acaulospora morrowiae]
KLFIRGIDIVKKGKSKYFKNVCEKVMRKIVDMNNEMGVFDTVLSMIESNMKMNEFANRMLKRDIKIEEGERFDYYIIKHPDRNAKIHQKMVLVKYFDDKKMKIDMKYYIKTLIGTLAHFINHYDQFQTNNIDYKKRDETSQKNAEKFLRDYVTMIDDRMTSYDIRDFFLIPASTKRINLKQENGGREK